MKAFGFFIALVALFMICSGAEDEAPPKKEIKDPLNIFCGPANCYDVLGVQPNATIRDIKKAYRSKTLMHHPDKQDKSNEENATAIFRTISKAHDVLTGNESRINFDYYLEHPRDYFKVSGSHLMYNVPKTNALLVLIVTIALMSWLSYTIQMQKYEKIVKFLKTTTLENLPLGMGGTKQTIELYRRASELYIAHVKDMKAKGDKKIEANKRPHKDAIFVQFVDRVVGEVKIEGGYAKPEFNDLFAVQLVYFPRTLYRWGCKWHRRQITKKLLPEDMIDMTIEAVGIVCWNEYSQSEQDKLVDLELWIPEKHDAWEIQKMSGSIAKVKKMARKNAKKGIHPDKDKDDK